MPIVKLKITVKRLEGRTKVDELDIAQNLAEAVEGFRFRAPDIRNGEQWLYEVKHVILVLEQLELPAAAAVKPMHCDWCEAVVPQVPGGRVREFCSDAHRQAAYRHRRNLA